MENLPAKLRNPKTPRSNNITPDDLPEMLTLDEVDRRYVLRVLEACHRNRTEAAKVLGVDRKTLYRRLVRWGVS